MIIRWPCAFTAQDVYLSPECIESIIDSFWPMGSSRVTMHSGEQHLIAGAAASLYQQLTDLGYTGHSRARRDKK